MSLFRRYQQLRFAILCLIAIPGAISIFLKGGPKDTFETGIALFAIAALHLILAMVVISIRKRRAQASPGRTGDDADHAQAPSLLGGLLLFGCISALLAGSVLFLREDLRRGMTSVRDYAGILMVAVVAILWLLILLGLLFPRWWEKGKDRK